MTSNQLLAYVTNHLNPADWDCAEDIAADALARAFRTGRPAHHIACDLIRHRATSYLARLTPPLDRASELAPVLSITRPRTPLPHTTAA